MSGAESARAVLEPVPPAARLPFLLAAISALVIGLGAGLARLGWAVPLLFAARAEAHGPLLVGAFLGTVIGLERAVALGRRWAYLAPLASGLAALCLVAGAPAALAQAALVAGAAVLCAVAARIYALQPAAHAAVIGLGALAWLAGNLLWQGGAPVASAVPWWQGFLILTIAGERLELTRFLPTPRPARRLFAAIVAAALLGLGLALLFPRAGHGLFTAALLALALWLSRYDLARRTVAASGLTRYIAVCLLSGYFWLGVGALGGLAGGLQAGSNQHDLTLHAVFVGFVFAMIFGHAPVILPAVLRLRVPYRPWFYLPLVLLHASLLLRAGGDLLAWPAWRALGGAGHALAIGLFIVTLLLSAAVGGQRVSAGGDAVDQRV